MNTNLSLCLTLIYPQPRIRGPILIYPINLESQQASSGAECAKMLIGEAWRGTVLLCGGLLYMNQFWEQLLI